LGKLAQLFSFLQGVKSENGAAIIEANKIINSEIIVSYLIPIAIGIQRSKNEKEQVRLPKLFRHRY